VYMKPKGVPTLREVARTAFSNYIIKGSSNLAAQGSSSSTLIHPDEAMSEVRDKTKDIFTEADESLVETVPSKDKQADNSKEILVGHVKSLRMSSHMKPEFERVKQCKKCKLACYESHIRMYEVDRVRNSTMYELCSVGCAESDAKFATRTMYRYTPNENIN
jgi:hypothetical protein